MSDARAAHRSKRASASQSANRTYYLVLWWMSHCPYAAVFENRIAAEAAANVRNALIITVSGRDLKFEEVVDWYRRDDEGRPMPAEWRDLLGQTHTPWLSKSTSLADAAEIA